MSFWWCAPPRTACCAWGPRSPQRGCLRAAHRRHRRLGPLGLRRRPAPPGVGGGGAFFVCGAFDVGPGSTLPAFALCGAGVGGERGSAGGGALRPSSPRGLGAQHLGTDLGTDLRTTELRAERPERAEGGLTPAPGLAWCPRPRSPDIVSSGCAWWRLVYCLACRRTARECCRRCRMPPPTKIQVLWAWIVQHIHALCAWIPWPSWCHRVEASPGAWSV